MASLDTTALIDLGNPRRPGHVAAATLLRAVLRRGEQICTTRINIAELRVGVERGSDRVREQQKFEQAVSLCVVLELDEAAGDRFGVIQAHLYQLGRPIGDMDALIAAICLTHGQSLITRNPKHFVDIPGLIVETY